MKRREFMAAMAAVVLASPIAREEPRFIWLHFEALDRSWAGWETWTRTESDGRITWRRTGTED